MDNKEINFENILENVEESEPNQEVPESDSGP
jgi:hypothetical protein